jgi:hypothetical protein
MPDIVADLPDPASSHLISNAKSSYLNHLVLISLRLARGRARGSVRSADSEAQALSGLNRVATVAALAQNSGISRA